MTRDGFVDAETNTELVEVRPKIDTRPSDDHARGRPNVRPPAAASVLTAETVEP